MDRFRVTARKFVHFQRRTSKLGPGYVNCNERQTSCTRRTADPRRGCPTCEWSIQYRAFRKELDTELAQLKTGTRAGPKKWPSKMLLEAVYETASIASMYDGQGPNWTVVTTLLVSILRSERAKIESAERFNQIQQAKAQQEANAVSRLGHTNLRPDEGED